MSPPAASPGASSSTPAKPASPPIFCWWERRIQEPLINALRAALSEMYGSQPQESPD
jgi:hypothetical protein